MGAAASAGTIWRDPDYHGFVHVEPRVASGGTTGGTLGAVSQSGRACLHMSHISRGTLSALYINSQVIIEVTSEAVFKTDASYL